MYITKKKYWPILFIIDIIGNILFFWKKLKKFPKNPKKVLFIRLEHIGDMIMSTPVYEIWKKNHPKCEVHVLCKTLTEPLIKNNPYVDKIFKFDPDWMLKRKDDKKTSYKEIVYMLKKEKYDIIFEMHGDPRNIMLANDISNNSFIVGYSCRGGGFFLNKIIDYDSKKQTIKQNIELITPFIEDSKIDLITRVYTDKSAKKKASLLMKKYDLKIKKYIILNPYSGRAEKDLNKQEIDYYINKFNNYTILISGSESEKEKNEKILRAYKNQRTEKRIINISGNTDLLTLTELVRNAKKVIAPDTGIIHIAKAVGTDFKCIYKTTDPKVWGYTE